jgi:hypothetical protein
MLDYEHVGAAAHPNRVDGNPEHDEHGETAQAADDPDQTTD